MRGTWAVGLLLMAALAGCADSSDDSLDAIGDDDVDDLPRASGIIPVAPDPAVFLGTVLNDHATGDVGHAGHHLPELHEGSHNLALADFNDLSEGLVGYGSAYSEVHVVGDLALVSSLFGSRGATLVDISDPSDLSVLSHIYNLGDNWDARLSEDGQYLFLGCQGTTVPGCASIETSGETPGATPQCESNGCGGILVYDIAEPTAPVLVGFVELGFTHNVFTFQKDGKYYFMNEGVSIAEWDPQNGTTQIASTEISGVHDIAVQQHPLTGDWLLYTGSGAHMSIWNVTDPFAPVLIGNVAPPEGESYPPMWHEQTPMPCLIDGRHITIGAGESGGGTPAEVAVLDTTDPTQPTLLGSWILPDHESITAQQMFRFSLHNIDGNCDGQVAVGHYHAGVWVFDVSTPERMAEPATLAYYLPSERSVASSASPLAGAPAFGVVMADASNVWSTQWSDDGQTLFIPDMASGLYSLRPDWDVEGAA